MPNISKIFDVEKLFQRFMVDFTNTGLTFPVTVVLDTLASSDVCTLSGAEPCVTVYIEFVKSFWFMWNLKNIDSTICHVHTCDVD